MNTHGQNNSEHLPADLAAMAGQLDRLASAERGSAAGLENRVFAASVTALSERAQGAPGLRLVGADEARPQARIVTRHVGWRLRVGLAAAALVAIAAASVVVLQSPGRHGRSPATGSGAGGANVASSDGVDSFLSVLAVVDTGTSTLNDRVENLVSDASGLQSGSGKLTDILSDTSDQGSL